jgi:hypothetical protein
MVPVYRAESLLEALGRVRRAMLVRRSSARSGKRSARVTYQPEELEAEIAPPLPIGGSARLVYTPVVEILSILQMDG